MNVSENLKFIATQLPDNVRLVAVSKTKPIESIIEAYNAGQRIFGENKVQELATKQSQLPDDIEWHLIGHLQTNKVKYIAPFVKLIHSIDSLKLLQVVNNEAIKNNRLIDCLLQIYIAQEETKFGLSEDELYDLFNSNDYKQIEQQSETNLKGIRIVGLMGMATFTDNIAQIRLEFRDLANIFSKLKSNIFKDKDYFTEISMGMSDDYQIAIDEGSTLVRIGSLIFGERINRKISN